MSNLFSVATHRQAILWHVTGTDPPRLPAMRRGFAVCLVCDADTPAWVREIAQRRARASSRVEALLAIQPDGGLRVTFSDNPLWTEGVRFRPSGLHWLDHLGRDVPCPLPLLSLSPIWKMSDAAGA